MEFHNRDMRADNEYISILKAFKGIDMERYMIALTPEPQIVICKIFSWLVFHVNLVKSPHDLESDLFMHWVGFNNSFGWN